MNETKKNKSMEEEIAMNKNPGNKLPPDEDIMSEGEDSGVLEEKPIGNDRTKQVTENDLETVAGGVIVLPPYKNPNP